MLFSKRVYMFNETRDKLRFALFPTFLNLYYENDCWYKKMIWLRFYYNRYIFRRLYNHPDPNVGRWYLSERKLAGTDTWYDQS